MKKLSILFAVAAMSLSLGVAGCKKKKEGDAAKTDDKAMAKPTDDKGTTPPPADKPAAAGDLPAECAEYKTLVEKLASCDKLPPQSRDALKQSFEASSKSWDQLGSLPPEAKEQMKTSCKTAVDAVKQTAAAACGW